MAQSILDAITRSLSPDLATQAASQLGESPTALSAGLGAAVPALLVGLLDKSRNPTAQRAIFDLIRDPANDGSALANPGSLLSTLGGGTSLSTLVSRFLEALFGGRSGAVAGSIGDSAGLQRSSAASLLSLAAPIVLGVLGDRVKREGLGAAGLFGLLGKDRDRILAAAPSGLATALGHSSLRDITTPAIRHESEEAAPQRRSWLLPAALGLFALLGLWRIFGNTPEPEMREAVVVEERVVEPPPVAAAAPTEQYFRRTLPGGYSLQAANSGVEQRLIGFLDDPNRAPDTSSWFDFDRLLFETDSATLKPESRVQLRDMAQILKAYPTVAVKIGGYTDSTGDAAANLALSQARAASVRNELVALGIAPERIDAEGYGASHPVASNDTEAGRAKNRRIALLVTAR